MHVRCNAKFVWWKGSLLRNKWRPTNERSSTITPTSSAPANAKANFTTFFRNVTTISTLRTRATQKEVNSTKKAKHQKSKRFSFDNVRTHTQSKVQSVNHVTQQGRHHLHQVKNRRRLKVWRRVFYLTMLTAYTLTLIVPKHCSPTCFWGIKFLLQFLQFARISANRLCNGFATKLAL